MSNRELEDKTAVIPALAGVNERTQKTDLQVQEFVRIEGTFPNQTGHQQKIPGKALLGKFNEGVYGIHQFWSPFGYGPNIYQFDGSVSVDPWITPPGGPITIPPLPPPPAWNENFQIIDEWGNPPNIPPTTSGPSVKYVNSGTSNGTEGTPGTPAPPSPPRLGQYNLQYFLIVINFGGAGVQTRDSADHVRVWTKNPKNGGVFVDEISARASDLQIENWNNTPDRPKITKFTGPQKGSHVSPLPPDAADLVVDPYMGTSYYKNMGIYWDAIYYNHFLDGTPAHIQTWNGYHS